MVEDESGIYAYEYGIKVNARRGSFDHVFMDDTLIPKSTTLTIYYNEQVSYDYEDGSHLGTQRKVTIPLKDAIDILVNHPAALERMDKGEYQ